MKNGCTIMRSLNAATANRRLICLEECPYGALKKNIQVKNLADYFDLSFTLSQMFFHIFWSSIGLSITLKM